MTSYLKGFHKMSDDVFKEVVINFLNGIYLNLRYMNQQIPKEAYDYCSKMADKALLGLLGDTDADQ